jgi:PASTA domain/Regulator of chromosome condensation (RCC1) repeat
MGQCSVPGGLSGVTAIAAGAYHSLAVKGDGTVVAWGCVGDGAPNRGQCSVPSGLFGVAAVAAGSEHSLALVVPANQTITFGALANKTYGDPDFSVSATASSGLAVSFAASGNCTVSGATVHLTGAGSCTVTASQAGNVNYNPAPDVSRTFAVAKAGQTITFGALPKRRYGAPDFRVSATASSGLAVSFAASGRCTVRAARVHLTGVGSCTVTASQSGDANYNAAPNVSRTFSIARAPCRVPKVVGKRVASAKRTIAQRQCRTGKVGYAYSRKRKKGIVVSQSRPPGKVLPARSKINLIVSRGRRP